MRRRRNRVERMTSKQKCRNARMQKCKNAERRIFAFLHFCILAFLLSSIVAGQSIAPGSKTRASVQALAAPALEGRLAGSNGEKLASDFLVTELKKLGARPVPGRSDFLMPFAFTAGTKDGGSTISVKAGGP